MKIKFDLSKTNRQALVNAISEITGAKAKYLGMPSAAYEIDYFSVDKNGTLEFDDSVSPQALESIGVNSDEQEKILETIRRTMDV